MKNSLENEQKRVVLGQIGKPHGIKGWLKLNSFTSPVENILDYSQLIAANKGLTEILEIDHSKRSGNNLTVHFKGYDSPESARKLTGVKLAVLSDCLPKLAEGEYYWNEIEGMEVLNQEGVVFGKISRLMETGSNDVLIVKPGAGSVDNRERLIPFVTGHIIKDVDIVARRMVVDWEIDFLE
jgi:16S rRNA processing protein RimM